MKKKLRIVKFISTLAFFIPLSLLSQNIIIDGEFRPRAEYRDGFQKPLLKSQKPVFLISQRTRLNVGYVSDLFETKISLQDVRIWGQTNIKSTGLPINLFEGWMKFNFLKYSSITIGRQVIKYDDNRLLSASSWSATGFSHDLVLYKYNNKYNGYKLDLGVGYNNSGSIKNTYDFYDHASDMYKMLNYLWTEKKFKNGLALSGIFIHEFRENPFDPYINLTEQNIKNYNRFTTGLNFKLSKDDLPVGFIFTGYYQFGQSPEIYQENDLSLPKHKSLSAFLFAGKIDFFINKNFTLTLGSDIYSGTKKDTINKISTTWNKLYGSNHSFNGHMEYWRNIEDYGLIDIFGTFTSHITKKLLFDLTYHFFSAQKELSYFEETSGKSLGSELDFGISWNFMKNAYLTAGWSTYFNSNNTLLVKNIEKNSDTRFQQWGFVSITFTPEFFKSKKLF